MRTRRGLLLVALLSIAAPLHALAAPTTRGGTPAGVRPLSSASAAALVAALAAPNPPGGFVSLSSGLAPLPPCPGWAALLPQWSGAARIFGVSWAVLAAINYVETSDGCDLSVSSAGAEGWTQFEPSTWARWGTDADGDGIADPYDSVDAIFSTARYLAASGAPADYESAILAYNHAQWYVDDVLALAASYMQWRRVPTAVGLLAGLHARVTQLHARAVSEGRQATQARAAARGQRAALDALDLHLGRLHAELAETLTRLQQRESAQRQTLAAFAPVAAALRAQRGTLTAAGRDAPLLYATTAALLALERERIGAAHAAMISLRAAEQPLAVLRIARTRILRQELAALTRARGLAVQAGVRLEQARQLGLVAAIGEH